MLKFLVQWIRYYKMTEDAGIFALFGSAPLNIDLNASEVSHNNAVVFALLGLAACAVILRFVARIVMRNAIMADDWSIVAALVYFHLEPTSAITDDQFLKACIGVSTGLSFLGKKRTP